MIGERGAITNKTVINLLELNILLMVPYPVTRFLKYKFPEHLLHVIHLKAHHGLRQCKVTIIHLTQLFRYLIICTISLKAIYFQQDTQKQLFRQEDISNRQKGRVHSLPSLRNSFDQKFLLEQPYILVTLPTIAEFLEFVRGAATLLIIILHEHNHTVYFYARRHKFILNIFKNTINIEPLNYSSVFTKLYLCFRHSVVTNRKEQKHSIIIVKDQFATMSPYKTLDTSLYKFLYHYILILTYQQDLGKSL